jgi:hypothetical protein
MIRFQFIELESRVCFCDDKRVLLDLYIRTFVMIPLNCVIPHDPGELLFPEIFLQ